MKEQEVVHVKTSELANIIEESMQLLDFSERIRIATGVLLDRAIADGDFGMRAETNKGMFRVTVRKEDD